MNSDSAPARIVSGQVHRREFLKVAAGSAGLAAVAVGGRLQAISYT